MVCFCSIAELGQQGETWAGVNMEETILIDLMVQLASLEAERSRCRTALAQDESSADFLRGLRDEYTADAGEAEARLARAQSRQRLAEGELESIETALARKQQLLGQSTDAKETLALQQEIANLESRQDILLEEGCQLLEQVESKDSSAGDMSAECVAQERKFVARLKEIDAQRELLTVALPEIEQEIERLHTTAPAAVARHLARLWAKDLQAVVFERDGACSGCGIQLRPQQALIVQHGKELIRCPACARFVVHKPWH